MSYKDTRYARHAGKPVTIATDTLYKWLDKQYRKGLDIGCILVYVYVVSHAKCENKPTHLPC